MENTTTPKHTSELSRLVSAETFEKAFKAFIEQADKNAISKKSEGSRIPLGLIDTKCDGADIRLRYGSGAASKTPYLNWWVLSIYYIVENQSIVMGIESDRNYPHLNKMNPIRYRQVGNRRNVAVFYQSSRDDIDYATLYETFISVAEEIMMLGLE